MRPEPSDADLALLLADALEPHDKAELVAQIEADPALGRRRDELARTLVEPPAPSSSWRIPPPGLGLRARTGLPAVLGTERIRAGDHFKISLPPFDEAGRLGVVVLREEDLGWVVLSPAAPREAVSLDRCARQDGVDLVVDLVARRPLGRQRWAVALLPLPVPEGPGEDPWSPVRLAVAEGRVPVGSVEIEVVER